MANFSYNDYQQVIARAQVNSENGTNGVKIGFFKMKNDKDEALIRFNISSLDNLQFATVHQLGAAQKWMKVGCLNPVGSYQDSCPLCAAVKAGNTSIGKASKKVYVQMLVSYKDPATQSFAAPIPVVWERPAAFSTEIANLIKDYGDLTQRVFKITRNGIAGNMQTTYSISYIPLYDKPETIPADFSAFVNFNIAKHSFWEKSVGDINVFLNTGSFPEAAKPQTASAAQVTTQAAGAPIYEAPQYSQAPAYNPPTQGFVPPAFGSAAAQPANTFTPPIVPNYAPVQTNIPAQTATPVAQPAPGAPTAPAAPAAAPIGNDMGRAPRTFGGLSF